MTLRPALQPSPGEGGAAYAETDEGASFRRADQYRTGESEICTCPPRSLNDLMWEKTDRGSRIPWDRLAFCAPHLTKGEGCAILSPILRKGWWLDVGDPLKTGQERPGSHLLLGWAVLLCLFCGSIIKRLRREGELCRACQAAGSPKQPGGMAAAAIWENGWPGTSGAIHFLLS